MVTDAVDSLLTKIKKYLYTSLHFNLGVCISSQALLWVYAVYCHIPKNTSLIILGITIVADCKNSSIVQ